MSDGLVAVYSLLNGLPVEGEAYLCSHTLNKTMFGLKDSDPRQNPYPVRSMVLVSSGSQVGRRLFNIRSGGVFRSPLTLLLLQLWFSNGPGVLVLDCWSLHAVRRLEPYGPPSSIISMTTSFTPWEEEAVWMLDDHVNTLLLYHAASFQLCAKYW